MWLARFSVAAFGLLAIVVSFQIETIEKAWQVACETRLRAHAPYSNFLVGAAVKVLDHDTLFTGDRQSHNAGNYPRPA